MTPDRRALLVGLASTAVSTALRSLPVAPASVIEDLGGFLVPAEFVPVLMVMLWPDRTVTDIFVNDERVFP